MIHRPNAKKPVGNYCLCHQPPSHRLQKPSGRQIEQRQEKDLYDVLNFLHPNALAYRLGLRTIRSWVRLKKHLNKN